MAEKKKEPENAIPEAVTEASAMEATQEPQDAAAVPDEAEDAEPPEAQVQPPEPEAQSVAAEPEPETPPPEQAVPYNAVTVPSALVVRKEPDGPAVATLPCGATIRVTGRRDGYAQMRNGLYVRESMIRPV